MNNKIISKLGKQLIQRNISITSAESLTAGMFQSTLGNIPGISKVFFGGFVTYSDHAKHQLLGINNQTINDYGVVSKEVAIQMAQDARKIMNTNIGVSFTGVAGPDSLENNPAGTVWIGLSFLNQSVFAKEFHFTGFRNEIRKKCVLKAFDLIERQLLN